VDYLNTVVPTLILHPHLLEARKKYIANIILEFGNTACPAPTNLTVTNISQTSADLSWTENGTATTWDIEYGATGYTQGTGTTITGVTNPYTLSGIPSATTYDWYVRASCGGSGVSTWAGLNTFSTLCNTVTTYPWTEDFENNGVFPPCGRRNIYLVPTIGFSTQEI